MDDKVVLAVRDLLESLLRAYGPWGTLAIFLAILGVTMAWRVYNEWRRGKETNAALAEKERTIQRLAEQEREWRIYFFAQQPGWNEEKARKLIVRAGFADGAEARRSLEGGPDSPPQTEKGKGKRK